MNNGSNSSLHKEDKVLQEQPSFEFSGSCSLEKRAEISDIYRNAPVGSCFVYEVESTDGKIGTVEFIKGKRSLEYDSHSGEVNFDENQKKQFFVGFGNNDKETAYLYGDIEKKIKKISVYIPKDNESLSEIAEDVTGNINNILEREKSILRGFSKNKERISNRFEHLLDLSHMKVVNETSNSLKTLEGLQAGEAIIIDGTNLAWLHLGNGEYIRGEVSFEGKLFKGTNHGGEKQSRTEVYNEIVEYYNKKDSELTGGKYNDALNLVNKKLEKEKSILRGFSKNKERISNRFEHLLDLSHMKVVNETSNSLKTLEGLQAGEAIIIDGTNLAWLHLGNGEYIRGEVSFEGKLFKGTNHGGEKQSRTEVYNEIVKYYNKKDSELTGGKYDDAGSLVKSREEIKKLFDLEEDRIEEVSKERAEEVSKERVEETFKEKAEETSKERAEELSEKKSNTGLFGKFKSKLRNYFGILRSKLRGLFKRNKKKQ